MKTKNRKVSITYQDQADRREEMARLAKEMGFKRSKNGVELGNLSPVLVLASEYVLAHESQFRKWVAEGKKKS